MILNDGPAVGPVTGAEAVELHHSEISHGLRRRAEEIRAFVREIGSDKGARITAALFVLFALPACILLALLVPPGEIADEPAHLLRADSLLYGEILGQRRPVTEAGKTVMKAGLVGDPGLVAADQPGQIGQLAQKKLSPSKLAAAQAISWAKRAVFIEMPGSAIYMPAFYVPGAIGIALARSFQFSPYQTIQAARIANALCFVLVGVCALLLASRGRILLFTVLCLPMSLSLAASCNQDGVIIATAVLAYALLTRALDPRGRAYWTAAILLATIIAVKIPYFPLALLLLLPCIQPKPAGYRKKLLTGLRTVSLVIAPGVIWLAVTVHFVGTRHVSFAPYHPGRLFLGTHDVIFDGPDPAAQIKVFLHRPLYLVGLPLRTIGEYWLGLRDEMIGRFGWLEFGLPAAMYPFWLVAIGCAILSEFLRERASPRGPPPLAGIIGLAAVLAAVCAVFDAFYLGWTPVGALLILGVQGRYLLPLLAAFAVFIPTVRIRGAAKLRIALAIPAFTVAAIGMVALPMLMVSTYYLR